MAHLGYNAVYDAVKPYVDEAIMELAPPDTDAIDAFDYVQSRERPSQHRLLENLGEYKAQPVNPPAHSRLGPVETEILQFANDPKVFNLALVGNIGSGKTTTMRYLMHHFLRPSKILVNYIDFQPIIQSLHAPGAARKAVSESRAGPPQDTAIIGSRSFDEEVVDETTGFVTEHLSIEEEIDQMWTWAFLQGKDSAARPAVRVIQGIKDVLGSAVPSVDGKPNNKRKLMIERLTERRRFLKKADLRTKLRYLLLRVRYLVSERFHNDPTKVLFVFDNVDQAPWDFHARLFAQAHSIASLGRCRVVVVMRPLTYASACVSGNPGEGHTIFYHVQHSGPDLGALLRRRLKQHLIDLADEKLANALKAVFARPHVDAQTRRVITLSTKKYAVEYRNLQIPFSCVKRWARAVVEGLFVRSRKRRLRPDILT